jgi:hypothetical protein
MVAFTRTVFLAICSLVIGTLAVPVPEYEPTSNTPVGGFNTMPNHPLGGATATIKEVVNPNLSPPTCEHGTSCDSRTGNEPKPSPPICENGTFCSSSEGLGNLEGQDYKI